MSELPNSVTKESLEDLIAKSEVVYTNPVGTLTHCVITLPCGYGVTGESACVDPAKYDKAIGEKYALEQAVDKLWPLEGYLLSNDLYRKSQIEHTDTFDFGTALTLVKLGDKLQRKGWNGSGMYIYYVPAASYPADRNSKSTMAGEFADDMVPYREYLALKTAQNDVSTWAPSVSDALAEDWQLA